MSNFSIRSSEVRAEWRIDEFYRPFSALYQYRQSPTFNFSGISWLLEVKTADGWLGVNLKRETAMSSVEKNFCHKYLEFSISLRTAEGLKNRQSTRVIVSGSATQGFSRYLRISEIPEKATSVAPSGVLTIVCCLSNYVPAVVSRTEDLSRDLEVLLGDKTRSDVTFHVQGTEFRLHRNVLGARSPVFDAMFKHEMSERLTGHVPIENCRSDVFRVFVRYLYTGKVEGVSADDLFDLYSFADMYRDEKLAEGCAFLMADMLTIDTFCDTVNFAFDRNHDFLLSEMVQFFLENKGVIVKTEKWQKLLSQNPARANDVLVRAFPE